MEKRGRPSGEVAGTRTVSRPRRATAISLGSRAAARGQGAIEYLMTYGWMILLVVIIGGALYGLGIFDPTTWSGGKRANGFTSLQIKDWKISPSATTGATLVVGNRYGEGLTITAFHFNTTTSPVVGCTYGYPAPASVALAENQEVTLVSDSCNATSLTKGKSYTADVRVEFSSSAGVSHTDLGTVSGKVD